MLSIIDELYRLATAQNAVSRSWYGRKLRLLPPEQHKQILELLKEKGVDPPANYVAPIVEEVPLEEETGPKRKMVTWSSEEWDALAQTAWKIRKNSPTESLIGILKKAQCEFPEERRRSIYNSVDAKPLINRMIAIDQKLMDKKEEADKLREEIDRLKAENEELTKLLSIQETPYDIINRLSEEEILNSFFDKVIQLSNPSKVLSCFTPSVILDHLTIADIIGHLVSIGWRALETSQNNQTHLNSILSNLVETIKKPSPTLPTEYINSIPPPKDRLPKITVGGLLPNQCNALEKEFSGKATFHFIDKNRKANEAFPNKQDLIILARFVDHALSGVAKSKAHSQGIGYIQTHGGVDTISEEIRKYLKKSP